MQLRLGQVPTLISSSSDAPFCDDRSSDRSSVRSSDRLEYPLRFFCVWAGDNRGAQIPSPGPAFAEM